MQLPLGFQDGDRDPADEEFCVPIFASPSSLPLWTPEPNGEAERFVRFCHTEKCQDFQNGHCRFHKPMLCFNFHFESQRRRPAVDPITGRLQYWDVPCEWLAHPGQCPRGDACHLAHSKDEISYHPAKYKTRRCNGKDCRQDICCFAHFDGELRLNAPRLYSQASVCPGGSQKLEESAASTGMVIEPFDLATFKVLPCTRGRGAPHDRKLCPFYHNLRDRRREPGSYVAEPCDECFDVETPPPGRCKNGDNCQKCHNRLELLYHPDVFKLRFCSTFPDVSSCQRGAFCAFAHSEKEIGKDKLFSEEEERSGTDDFYMYRFKTLWCPFGRQHDWHNCHYAHTYQDWRRAPELGYGSEPCPHWVKNLALSDYARRCPNGFLCQYSHGSKEQLYHPSYYKTMPCTDWTNNLKCPRRDLCAFFHDPGERRKMQSLKYDYAKPLQDAETLERCQPGYTRPPLFTLEDDPDREDPEEEQFASAPSAVRGRGASGNTEQHQQHQKEDNRRSRGGQRAKGDKNIAGDAGSGKRRQRHQRGLGEKQSDDRGTGGTRGASTLEPGLFSDSMNLPMTPERARSSIEADDRAMVPWAEGSLEEISSQGWFQCGRFCIEDGAQTPMKSSNLVAELQPKRKMPERTGGGSSRDSARSTATTQSGLRGSNRSSDWDSASGPSKQSTPVVVPSSPQDARHSSPDALAESSLFASPFFGMQRPGQLSSQPFRAEVFPRESDLVDRQPWFTSSAFGEGSAGSVLNSSSIAETAELTQWGGLPASAWDWPTFSMEQPLAFPPRLRNSETMSLDTGPAYVETGPAYVEVPIMDREQSSPSSMLGLDLHQLIDADFTKPAKERDEFKFSNFSRR